MRWLYGTIVIRLSSMLINQLCAEVLVGFAIQHKLFFNNCIKVRKFYR